MTDAILATNSVIQNWKTAIEDGIVTEQEAQNIFDAAVGGPFMRKGVSPGEMAQAQVLADNLFDVMKHGQMTGMYADAVQVAADDSNPLGGLILAGAEAGLHLVAELNRSRAEELAGRLADHANGQGGLKNFYLSVVCYGDKKVATSAVPNGAI